MIYLRLVIYRCAHFAALAAPPIIGVSTLLLFSRLLSDVAGNAFPLGYLGHFLMLVLLKYAPQLLMIISFAGAFFAIHQFFRQNQMQVWFFSGLGLRHFVLPLGLFALPVALVIAVLTLEVSPWAERSIKITRALSAIAIEPENLARGRFLELPGGGQALYWGDDGDIFIAQAGAAPAHDIIFARNLSRADGRNLRLDDGRLFHLENRADDDGTAIEVMGFDTLELSVPTTENVHISARGQSFFALGFDDKSDAAEIIWRINLPVMTIILIVAALFIAAGARARARGIHTLAALAVFFLALNFLRLIKGLMESGEISALVGLAAPPLFIMAVVTGLYHLQRRTS